MSANEASSQPPCWRAPDPKYLFQFVNDDGSAATWHRRLGDDALPQSGQAGE